MIASQELHSDQCVYETSIVKPQYMHSKITIITLYKDCQNPTNVTRKYVYVAECADFLPITY